jgi:hypothetical protein
MRDRSRPRLPLPRGGMEPQWAASPRAHRLLRLAADGQGDRSAVLAKVALERQITLIWVVAAVHRKRAGRVPNGGSCAPFSVSAVAPHGAFREQDAHPGQFQPALGRDVHDPACDCCPKCPTPGRPVSGRRSPLQSIFHGPALTPKTNCNIFRQPSSCASCAPNVPVFTGT